MKKIIITLAVMFFTAGPARADSPDAPLQVYVISHSLKQIAAAIGGDDVEVHFPIEPTIDISDWIPTEDIVLRYQQADLILYEGTGFDSWLAHVSLPIAAMINTFQSLEDPTLQSSNRWKHAHGDGPIVGKAEHADEPADAYDRLVAQARVIRDSFVSHRPQQATSFHDLFDRWVASLND